MRPKFSLQLRGASWNLFILWPNFRWFLNRIWQFSAFSAFSATSFTFCTSVPHLCTDITSLRHQEKRVSLLSSSSGTERSCLYDSYKFGYCPGYNRHNNYFCLKKVDLDSIDGERKEKKKVQWVDLTGKELGEIREFVSSEEEEDIRYDGNQSCVCVIM